MYYPAKITRLYSFIIAKKAVIYTISGAKENYNNYDEPAKLVLFYLQKGKPIMTEIIKLLPILAIAISMNIAAGLYYSIGTKELSFSWKKFISGIFKASIIAYLFIGTAYCFESTDLSSLGVEPMFIMTSAIALYVGKAVVSLGKILGIEVKTKQ